MSKAKHVVYVSHSSEIRAEGSFKRQHIVLIRSCILCHLAAASLCFTALFLWKIAHVYIIEWYSKHCTACLKISLIFDNVYGKRYILCVVATILAPARYGKAEMEKKRRPSPEVVKGLPPYHKKGRKKKKTASGQIEKQFYYSSHKYLVCRLKCAASEDSLSVL